MKIQVKISWVGQSTIDQIFLLAYIRENRNIFWCAAALFCWIIWLQLLGEEVQCTPSARPFRLKHKYFQRCEESSTRNTYVKSGTFCKLVQFVQPDRLQEFAQDWIAKRVSMFQFTAEIFASSSVHLHSNLNICSDCWVCVDELPALVHIINCLLKVKRALQCVHQGLWGSKRCLFKSFSWSISVSSKTIRFFLR